MQPAPVRLSVIVPVGRGDQDWRSLLPCLATLGGDCELLVVAADDQVGPQAADALPPLRWLAAPAGRANQQNAGAAAARGALLWFLHCDSRPDARALQAAASLPASFDALGWFRLGFHDGGPLLALNALGANLRSRAGLPFGDQGLLLPAAGFRALGGFDPRLQRGEDLDLVVRARAAGTALVRLPGTVATSARRYRDAGWAATTLRHLWLTATLFRAARRRARRHANAATR